MREMSHKPDLDVYAEICEPFGNTYRKKQMIRLLGNTASAFGAAFGVFLLVPVIQMVTTQLGAIQEPPEELNQVTLSPPAEWTPPPPPKPKDIIKEPDPDIKYRPDFDQIEISMFSTIGKGIHLPGISIDTVDYSKIDAVLDIGDVDEVPRAIKTVAPVYPQTLKRSGIGGRVILEFIVDEQGDVINPDVIDGKYAEFKIRGI